MGVTVRTGGALRSLLGGERETQVDGSSVRGLIESLDIKDRVCDGDGNLRRHFSIHVNESEDVRLLDGLDTAVGDGDVVTILSAIAGGGEIARKVWLTFPPDTIDKPFIWEIGRKFKVVTNIRQASVTKELGLIGLGISGEAEDVGQALAYLTENGITVEPIELDVVE